MKSIYAGIFSLVLAFIFLPKTVKAEISPNPSPSWGVEGMLGSNFTGPILSEIWAIEQIGDRIYIGGKFTSVRNPSNGSLINQVALAAFDVNSGDWISSFRPIFNGPVYSLEKSADGSKLYVGGEFASVNGQQFSEALVALNPITGEVDSSFDPRVDNWTTSRNSVVKTMHEVNGYLYIGGYFSRLNRANNEIAVTNLGRVNAQTGIADASWRPDVNGGSVWGIDSDQSGSRIYVVGRFDNINNDSSMRYMGVLSASSGLAFGGTTSYISQANETDRAYLHDIEIVGNRVWVGGSEHIVLQMDMNTNVLRRHSTSRGGDYQDIEQVGDRIYASCHCYTNHHADWDLWLDGFDVPSSVLTTPVRYVAAYDALSGDYIQEFYLEDLAAHQSGVWAIHGDTNGCLWLGGDLSRGGLIASGNDQPLHGFARFCDGGSSGIPAPTALRSTYVDKTRTVLNYGTVTGAVSYNIYRDGILVASDDNGWHTNLGLSPGTTYSYYVTAVDANGNESDPSNTIAVTTDSDVIDQPPLAPTNLRTTYQNKSRIVLNYGLSDGAVSYNIYRDGIKIAVDDNAWFTDTGLTAGTTYAYYVTAVNAGGQESTPSNSITATTTGTAPGGPISAPTNLRNTYVNRTRAVLNYGTVDGAVSYNIYRDGVIVDTDDNDWHTNLGLSPGTTYVYYVTAVDANGNESDPSNSVSVTTNP